MAETIQSVISVLHTHFFMCRQRKRFLRVMIHLYSLKLTVSGFRGEAAPPRLRTQSFYLTQVMREAGQDNLSAQNGSPVSHYGFFTRLLLHTNELFNNSFGQWNKLSTELCGNSSGTDEDSTSGSACLSSQVLLGWDQLWASVLALQRDHLQVRMKTCSHLHVKYRILKRQVGSFWCSHPLIQILQPFNR